MQIWANKEEREKMDVNHWPSLPYIQKGIKKVKTLKPFRAIDVGCGDGLLTRDLLLYKFTKVDMFDRCPKAIKIVKELKKDNKRIQDVEIAEFNDFEFKHKYNGIFMRWVSGYMLHDKLVEFLRKAKKALDTKSAVNMNEKGPCSFIFFMDNVMKDGYDTDDENG